MKSRTQEDIMFSIIKLHDTLVMVLKDLDFSNEDIKYMNLPGSDVVKAMKEGVEVSSKFAFSKNWDGDVYIICKDGSTTIIEKGFFYKEPKQYIADFLNQLLIKNLEREVKLRVELLQLELIHHKLEELIGI